jgi:hypothetical protein
MLNHLPKLIVLTLLLASSAHAADADGWTSLFNGMDTAGWKLRSPNQPETWKVVGDVKLDAADNRKLTPSGEGAAGSGVLFRQYLGKGPDGKDRHGGSDIYTEQDLGDAELSVEFMVPKGSNSGVYLMGRYEVQVLDSFGKPDDKLSQGDVGAIYSAAKPSTNAAKAPGEWQTMEIRFQAPRFDDTGKKTQDAKFLSVKLNGKEIQKDVPVQKPTGGHISDKEAPTGPLLFQGDHGIVAFRNVKYRPLGK